jgi:4-amino-4-deoxy-L-arabinose transferase-like glycosyltransferase
MKRVWLILGAGLLLRACYAAYVWPKQYIPISATSSEPIAASLLSGGGYSVDGHPTSFREPGFPLFIAATYVGVGGRRPWAVPALQCLVSVVTAGLIFLLGRRLFGEKAGLIAAAAYAVYPQAIYYCAYFFRETIEAFWIAGLALASTYWKDKKKGDRAALLGGFAAAAAGLTNSGLLPAAVFSGAMLRGRRLLFYYAPVVLLVGAWTTRNSMLQGRLVLGATNGGEEFYQALVVPPDQLGTEGQTKIIAEDPTFHEGGPEETEGERNSRFLKASVRWIAAHPGLYARRAVAGLVKFWRLWPYNRRYDHAYWKLVLASLLFDGWIVPLGLFALWRERRRFRDAPAAWTAVCATWLLYGLVHAVIRYRMPIMPIVTAFAASVL